MRRSGLQVWVVTTLDGQELSRSLLHSATVQGIINSMEPAPSPGSGAVAGTIRPADPPISEARKGWGDDMRRRGCVPSSVRAFSEILSKCCAYTGWQTVGSVTLGAAMEWLAHQRDQGWSGTTSDRAASALRCFGDYLRKAGHTSVNVLHDLEPSGEQGEEGSRALTLEEARAMIRVARERETRDRRAKGNRALFYCFLCLTGLRANEAARVRWRDVQLDGVPQITTSPDWSKNGKRQRVVLNTEIAGLLREHRRAVDSRPDGKVFPTVPNRATWRDTRERAGIPPDDDRGRTLSQHGCRKFFASILDRTGASPGVVARLLRHATGITQQRYIDPQISEEIEAVEKIPRLWPDPGNPVPDGTYTHQPPGSPHPNGADNQDSLLRNGRMDDKLPLTRQGKLVPNGPTNSAPEARTAVVRPDVSTKGTAADARASGVEFIRCGACSKPMTWDYGTRQWRCLDCEMSPQVAPADAHSQPQNPDSSLAAAAGRARAEYAKSLITDLNAAHVAYVRALSAALGGGA